MKRMLLVALLVLGFCFAKSVVVGVGETVDVDTGEVTGPEEGEEAPAEEPEEEADTSGPLAGSGIGMTPAEENGEPAPGDSGPRSLKEDAPACLTAFMLAALAAFALRD